MDRKYIPRTTLLCLDTLNHQLAARALKLSLAGCAFERALFLTDRSLDVEGAETIQVARIADRADYSRRILRDLCDFVRSEFVLVIQWDGYVLHPDAWEDTFLDYDYIGARWEYDDGKSVGNGGFSLRSRRLLRALGAAQVTVVGSENEDEVICRRLRPSLEREHAVRFSPEAVADRFSIERVGENTRAFGFHGLFNMANLVSPEELVGFCALVPNNAYRSLEYFEFLIHMEKAGRGQEVQTISAQLARRMGASAVAQNLERARMLVRQYDRIRQTPQQA